MASARSTAAAPAISSAWLARIAVTGTPSSRAALVQGVKVAVTGQVHAPVSALGAGRAAVAGQVALQIADSLQQRSRHPEPLLGSHGRPRDRGIRCPRRNGQAGQASRRGQHPGRSNHPAVPAPRARLPDRNVTHIHTQDQPQARATCALSSSRHRMITRKDAMGGSADYVKPWRDGVSSVLRRVTCGRPVN